MTSRLCSMTMTVLPLSTSPCRTRVSGCLRNVGRSWAVSTYTVRRGALRSSDASFTLSLTAGERRCGLTEADISGANPTRVLRCLAMRGCGRRTRCQKLACPGLRDVLALVLDFRFRGCNAVRGRPRRGRTHRAGSSSRSDGAVALTVFAATTLHGEQKHSGLSAHLDSCVSANSVLT